MDQSFQQNALQYNNYQNYNINCHWHPAIQSINWNPLIQQHNQQNNHQQYNYNPYLHYQSPPTPQQPVAQPQYHSNTQHCQMQYSYTQQQSQMTATDQVQQPQSDQKETYATVIDKDKMVEQLSAIKDDKLWWKYIVDNFNLNHFKEVSPTYHQTQIERGKKDGGYLIFECKYGHYKVQLHTHIKFWFQQHPEVTAVNLYLVTNRDFPGFAEPQREATDDLYRKHEDIDELVMENLITESMLQNVYQKFVQRR